ncbi:MAG: RDD family protein [Reyranellaceae bacterium]
MAQPNVPVPFRLRLNAAGSAPDPITEPQYYDGLLSRRVVAYFIDLLLIGAIWVGLWIIGSFISVVTFGLFWPLVILAITVLAPAYHAFFVGSAQAATPGMSLMGLQVRTFDDQPPTFLHALVQIVLFYVTVPTTGGLVLLVVLFNRHRRTLHDILSHLIVLRRLPPGTVTSTPPRR